MLIGSLVALYSNASGAEMKCMSPVGIPARDVNNLSTLHMDVKTRSSCLPHHGHGHRRTLNLSVISLTKKESTFAVLSAQGPGLRRICCAPQLAWSVYISQDEMFESYIMFV